ncbi:MAG: hypothetical protein L0H93_07770 [Nocardioides sp.]|nr:hypothetical protein [Nocardioides sp.]
MANDTPLRVWIARLRDPLIILATFVLAGLFCGWLWHHLWAPAPTGLAFKGKMYFPDDTIFRGTGIYMLIAIVGGLVLGALLTWLLERDEVVTLVAVLVGAVLAGLVMGMLGSALGPESPQAAADALTKDPGNVTGNLTVAPLARWTCFPGAAIVGALLVLVTFTRRGSKTPELAVPEPEGSDAP